jgi:hypothetical protein
MIDVLLEVRHREACVLAVEDLLADVLAEIPPLVRVYLRTHLRRFFAATLPPVCTQAEYEMLRTRIAAEDPVLAFRLRALSIGVSPFIEPLKRMLDHPEAPAVVAHVVEYAESEMSRAFVDRLDESIRTLGKRHGRKTEAAIQDYLSAVKEQNPELDRLVGGVATMVKDALAKVDRADEKRILAELDHALDAPLG